MRQLANNVIYFTIRNKFSAYQKNDMHNILVPVHALKLLPNTLIEILGFGNIRHEDPNSCLS